MYEVGTAIILSTLSNWLLAEISGVRLSGLGTITQISSQIRCFPGHAGQRGPSR